MSIILPNLYHSFTCLVPGQQGPVSRKSRELYGPEKPVVKLRPAYFVKLVFSYVVKGPLQGPVSRKSPNFSGVFRVTQFSLHL